MDKNGNYSFLRILYSLISILYLFLQNSKPVFIQTMLKLIKSNRLFFIPYLLVLFLGLFILLEIPKLDIMLWINHHTYSFLDPYFIFMTEIGDGLAFSLLAFVLIWFSYRKSIQAWLIFGLSSITAQFLKRLVFNHSLRPYAFFQEMGFDMKNIRILPGIQILMQNSFPSGHSITGFSLSLLICFWVRNKAYALACLVLGLSIAYSRMYLFEHFFWDCYAGSILGVILCTLSFYYLDKTQWPNAPWADKGLRDQFKKK